MDKKLYYLKLIVSFLVISSLLSCATSGNWQRERAKQNMQVASDFYKKGDSYSALISAIECLKNDSKNDDCIQLVKQIHVSAINREAKSLRDNPPRDLYELERYKGRVDNLQMVQSSLISYNFTANIIINVDELMNYEEFSKKITRSMNDLYAKKNADELGRQIEKYKELQLPANNDFVELINGLSLLYFGQNRYDAGTDFTRKNLALLKDDTKKTIFDILYKVAKKDAAGEQKMKALKTFSFLLELDKGNEDVTNWISRLRNELITMLAVLEIENGTDEIIKIDNQEFLTHMKSKIDDAENLVEVMIHDEGIEKLKSMCADSDGCYSYLKKQKLLNVKFQNNIRYLIIPRVKSFKVQRQSPSMKTVSFRWDFNRESAFAVGLNEYSAYGRYKVQYYQCDVYSEKVVGQMVLNILVYDALKNKLILEDRLQFQTEDTAQWGENPTVVGIINKIPATTVYPAAMGDLINARRSTSSDDDITKEMLLRAEDEISDKVKSRVLNYTNKKSPTAEQKKKKSE